MPFIEDIAEVADSRDCAICLVSKQEGGLIYKLFACEHSYHGECLQNFIRSRPNTTCPLCRGLISEGDKNELVAAGYVLVNPPRPRPSRRSEPDEDLQVDDYWYEDNIGENAHPLSYWFDDPVLDRQGRLTREESLRRRNILRLERLYDNGILGNCVPANCVLNIRVPFTDTHIRWHRVRGRALHIERMFPRSWNLSRWPSIRPPAFSHVTTTEVDGIFNENHNYLANFHAWLEMDEDFRNFRELDMIGASETRFFE